MEQSKAQSTVTTLFVATDQQDWSTVEAQFAEKVHFRPNRNSMLIGLQPQKIS